MNRNLRRSSSPHDPNSDLERDRARYEKARRERNDYNRNLRRSSSPHDPNSDLERDRARYEKARRERNDYIATELLRQYWEIERRNDISDVDSDYYDVDRRPRTLHTPPLLLPRIYTRPVAPLLNAVVVPLTHEIPVAERTERGREINDQKSTPSAPPRYSVPYEYVNPQHVRPPEVPARAPRPPAVPQLLSEQYPHPPRSFRLEVFFNDSDTQVDLTEVWARNRRRQASGGGRSIVEGKDYVDPCQMSPMFSPDFDDFVQLQEMPTPPPVPPRRSVSRRPLAPPLAPLVPSAPELPGAEGRSHGPEASESSASSAPPPRYSRDCGVCFEEPRDRAALSACGHLLCLQCAEKLADGGQRFDFPSVASKRAM